MLSTNFISDGTDLHFFAHSGVDLEHCESSGCADAIIVDELTRMTATERHTQFDPPAGVVVPFPGKSR